MTPLITADQILLHLIGDYLLQSDWMAHNKTRDHFPAAMHALAYSLPFQFLLTPSVAAMAVIAGTHFFIDRYRLARYVVWLKNCMAPWIVPWAACSTTGYPPDKPTWMAVWLLIIADNILHLVVNGLALKYL